MVQIDIPVAFSLGALQVDAAREQIQAGVPAAAPRALVRNLLFFAAFASWLPIQLLVRHFGFETSHMWWHEDSVLAYPWFIPLFMLIYVGANLFGFWLAVRLVRAGLVGLNRALIAAGFLFATLWVVLQSHRTLVLGTYREWAAGAAPPISSDPHLVRLLVVVGVVFSAALAATYAHARREARSG